MDSNYGITPSLPRGDQSGLFIPFFPLPWHPDYDLFMVREEKEKSTNLREERFLLTGLPDPLPRSSHPLSGLEIRYRGSDNQTGPGVPKSGRIFCRAQQSS